MASRSLGRAVMVGDTRPVDATDDRMSDQRPSHQFLPALMIFRCRAAVG